MHAALLEKALKHVAIDITDERAHTHRSY